MYFPVLGRLQDVVKAEEGVCRTVELLYLILSRIVEGLLQYESHL